MPKVKRKRPRCSNCGAFCSSKGLVDDDLCASCKSREALKQRAHSMIEDLLPIQEVPIQDLTYPPSTGTHNTQSEDLASDENCTASGSNDKNNISVIRPIVISNPPTETGNVNSSLYEVSQNEIELETPSFPEEMDIVSCSSDVPGVSKKGKHFCRRCHSSGHNIRTCKRRKLNVDTFDPVQQDAVMLSDAEDDPSQELQHSVEAVTEGDIEYLHCKCCHRQDSAQFSVSFIALDVEFVVRSFGSRDYELGDNVCLECHQYLAKANKRPNFGHAWPAFFFSLLTEAKFDKENIARNIVCILPKTIKSTYNSAVNRIGSQHVQLFWPDDPFCVDVTKRIQRFTNMIGSASWGNLKKAANETAYPDILCPIGCYAHVEDLSDGFLDLLPIHHYISKFVDLKAFGMNKEMCRGFKPSWPCIYEELNHFSVAPSLYVDQQKGLCIVMCSSKIHADASREFLHVPYNPILHNDASAHEDFIAPVTVCPKIVRCGKSNSNTTSFTVCKLAGVQAGISSFTLRTERSVQNIETTRHYTAMGIALKHRPDIYASIVDRPFIPPSFAQNVLNFADPAINHEVLNDKLLAEIKDERARGTTVSMHDSLLALKTLEQIGTNTNNVEVADKTIIKVPTILTHVNDGYGHAPIEAPFYLVREAQSLLSAMLCLLSILSNCRPLYKLLIKCSHERTNRAFVDLHKIISSMMHCLNVTGVVRSQKLLKLGKDLLKIDEIDATCESSAQTIVKSMLKYFTNLNTLDAHTSDDVVLLLNAVEDVLLIDCSDIEDDDLPIESHDSSCSLLFAMKCNVAESYSYTFRWNVMNKWWKCSTTNTGRPIRTAEFALTNPTFLVYATPNATKCMDEGEYLNVIGSETKLKCLEHDCYMVKCFKGGLEICSFCRKKRAFKCSFDLFPSQECTAGLCTEHAKHLRAMENPDKVPARPENATVQAVRVENEQESPQFMPSTFNDDNDGECNIVVDLNVPESLNTGSSVVQREDYGDSTSGHFLVNSYLKCFVKSFINKKPPIKWQQQLGMINALCPSQTFPLL